MTDGGPRIYGRAGDVEVTVEGSDDETTEDISDTFDEKLEKVSEKRVSVEEDLEDNGPTKGCE